MRVISIPNAWDIQGTVMLNSLGLPARSALYHMEPIGVGTAVVESLTSYIGRLAEAHCVSVGVLVAREILPVFGRDYLSRPPKVEGTFWRKSVALNGTGKWAEDCVRVLEVLTKRSDLRYLTMLAWREVLSHRGLLRRIRAWCPFCLEELKEKGEVIYEPLAWTLEVMTMCPRHRCRLLTRCPTEACNQQMPVLTPQYRPGYCSRCCRWLGQSAASHVQISPAPSVALDALTQSVQHIRFDKSVRPTEGSLWETSSTTNRAFNEQCYVWQSVDEMLTTIPGSAKVLPKSSVAIVLSRYLATTSDGDPSEFARMVGVSRRSLQSLLCGEQTPQLGTLLMICAYLGTSPRNFLTHGATQGNRNEESKPIPQPAKRVKPKKRLRIFDKEQIGTALQRIAREEAHPPPSMRDVGRRLGYDASHLYRHFPAVCALISARYKVYVKAKREKRVLALRNQVNKVAHTIIEQGNYPTHRRVRAQMPKPRVMYEPDAISAWHEALHELGLT